MDCFIPCDMSFVVSHERNLMWSQQDHNAEGLSRIVGVSGDPIKWVANRTASTRYITAPNKVQTSHKGKSHFNHI